MAITYSATNTGGATITSSAALTATCPATITANDVLIAHVAWKDTTSTPATPSGWTLLFGPRDIGTGPDGRHWIFGKLAAGTEDGSTVDFGTEGGTTLRWGRIYRFIGWVDGTITGNVNGFTHTVHATDPQMPTVTTTAAGALAVACIAQNDDNSIAAATGATGGTWVEAVAEFLPALGTGAMMNLQRCTPTTDPGTVSGGACATANDPVGVIGFQIRASVPAAGAGRRGELLAFRRNQAVRV